MAIGRIGIQCTYVLSQIIQGMSMHALRPDYISGGVSLKYNSMHSDWKEENESVIMIIIITIIIIFKFTRIHDMIVT